MVAKFLKKLFPQKATPKEFTNEELEQDYELKKAGLEYVLGKSHELVGHAVVPFELGGAVDMYYFPNGISGTGFATMELIQPDGKGPIPNNTGTFELVAFTKLDFVQDAPETHPFSIIERQICGILTGIGFYAFDAKIQPLDTCEMPKNENEPKLCLIFDDYKPNGKDFIIGNRKHGLLLVMEVHKDEMEYAITNGTKKLIGKLKEKNFYPYSDLNRASVV